VAAGFAREIATAPAYARLGVPRRAVLALLTAALIVLRFPGGFALRRLLQALRLGRLEAAAIAWVRSRD
jgi:hypothetical protein